MYVTAAHAGSNLWCAPDLQREEGDGAHKPAEQLEGLPRRDEREEAGQQQCTHRLDEWPIKRPRVEGVVQEAERL